MQMTSEPVGNRDRCLPQFFSMSSQKLVARRQPKSVTVGSTAHLHPDGTTVRLPMVRLRGQWLAAAGFAIGCGVEIKVRHGELCIKVIRNKGLLQTVSELET